jgi:hypothetical protein
MSERIYIIYVEKRSLHVEELRDEVILTEKRSFRVDEEERVLEVLLP